MTGVMTIYVQLFGYYLVIIYIIIYLYYTIGYYYIIYVQLFICKNSISITKIIENNNTSSLSNYAYIVVKILFMYDIFCCSYDIY